jgi:hypothetical protein
MEFHTHTKIPTYPFQVNHKTHILMMGSCFSEQIGDLLQKRWFRIMQNPFGITFNPLSLQKQLADLTSGRQIPKNSLDHHQGLWFHPDFHGAFSHPDASMALQKMNNSLKLAHQHVQKRPLIIFLTPGTAFAWWRQDALVNNCHKLPDHLFSNKLLDLDMLKQTMGSFFETLDTDIQIIWTISPVRHSRQGFVANNQSKAVLHLLIQDLTRQFSHHHYFPSYELVLDDLRDYRFFGRDLLHPNELAVEYVWEKFQEAFFDAETKSFVQEISRIERAKAHKPLHPESETTRQFLIGIQEQERSLKNQLGL